MVTIFVGRVNDAYHDGDAEDHLQVLRHLEGALLWRCESRCVCGVTRGGDLRRSGHHGWQATQEMHGAVDASHVRQDDYIGPTSSHGFKKGVSNPALLHHAERHI
eukprot:8774219-Pyramimonas_sp.AAC.2